MAQCWLWQARVSAIADGFPALQPLLQKAADVAIPEIVLGEYRYGIRQSRSRLRYERWLENLTAACRVLPIDKGTAEEYAEVRDQLKKIGRPIPGNDLWNAALARQYAMPLLGRDREVDSVLESAADWLVSEVLRNLKDSRVLADMHNEGFTCLNCYAFLC